MVSVSSCTDTNTFRSLGRYRVRPPESTWRGTGRTMSLCWGAVVQERARTAYLRIWIAAFLETCLDSIL